MFEKVQLSKSGGARRNCVLALLLILGALQVSPVLAESITVEGDCTLAQAIESANQDSAVGGCVSGDGADTIELTGNIALAEELPSVTSEVSIRAVDSRFPGEQLFRILFVSETGELTVERLTLREGQATEGARMCIKWEDGEHAAAARYAIWAR